MGLENQAADEAQFESGYSMEPTETPEPAKEPEAKEPAPIVAEVIDPMKVLNDRLDKFEKGHTTLAGQFGRLQLTQKEIQDRFSAAQAAKNQVENAPTQAQMDAAAGNKEKWNALETQYPDWTKAFEHRLSQIPKFDSVAIEKMVAEKIKGESSTVRQEIISNTLDAVYPGWAEEVKTEQFGKWLKSQAGWKPGFDNATELKSPESELSKFIAANPKSPVALYYSSKVGDAATMLRLYDQSKQTKPTPAPQKDISTRQKRLEAAVNPKGTGGHASASTDLDDFNAGYAGK